MKRKKIRKHTPIVSQQQRKFFGVELSKMKKGKKRKTDMSEEILEMHLEESKGKKLPKKVKRGRR